MKSFALLAAATLVVPLALAAHAFAQKPVAAQRARASNVPSMVRRFGCAFHALRPGFDLLVHPFRVAAIGTFECNSTTTATIRLSLLQNAVELPNGWFYKRFPIPAGTTPIRIASQDRKCARATYRSEMAVRVFHNGTSTILHAMSAPEFGYGCSAA